MVGTIMRFSTRTQVSTQLFLCFISHQQVSLFTAFVACSRPSPKSSGPLITRTILLNRSELLKYVFYYVGSSSLSIIFIPFTRRVYRFPP